MEEKFASTCFSCSFVPPASSGCKALWRGTPAKRRFQFGPEYTTFASQICFNTSPSCICSLIFLIAVFFFFINFQHLPIQNAQFVFCHFLWLAVGSPLLLSLSPSSKRCLLFLSSIFFFTKTTLGLYDTEPSLYNSKWESFSIWRRDYNPFFCAKTAFSIKNLGGGGLYAAYTGMLQEKWKISSRYLTVWPPSLFYWIAVISPPAYGDLGIAWQVHGSIFIWLMVFDMVAGDCNTPLLF